MWLLAQASSLAIAQVVSDSQMPSLHSLRGSVIDSARRLPVPGATIELRGDAGRRTTRTDDAGEFRIAGLPPGEYRLSIRQVGYRQESRVAKVVDRDVALALTLTPLPQHLAALLIRERLPGVYGAVGRAEDLRPIRGARIQVIGAERTALTDSLGAYALQVARSGTYLVRVSRAGYAEQLFAIDIPGDRVVEASRLLDTASAARGSAVDGPLQDLERRLVWRGMNSAVVSGGQLRKYGGSLATALQGSAPVVTQGLRIHPSACLFINGLPRPGWPVDAISAEDVEAIEVYGRGGDQTGMLSKRWPPRAPCGDATTSRASTGSTMYVVVWLKR